MRSRWFLAGGVVLVVGAIFFATRGDDDPKLDATSRALSRSADQCLYAVRDEHQKYRDAPDCTALRTLSYAYLEAGGGMTKTPDKYERRFAEARSVAWSALAMSEACRGGPLNIW